MIVTSDETRTFTITANDMEVRMLCAALQRCYGPTTLKIDPGELEMALRAELANRDTLTPPTA